jgi:predicted  nucleic acid-binding Zn-ribbon protein
VIDILRSCQDSDRAKLDSHQVQESPNPNPIPSDHTPPTFTPSNCPIRDVSNALPSTISHSHSGSNSFTLEDRLKQLQHSLSLLTSERDTLTASLKSARRDAQKADAALRSEIDILKRASEKHTAAEHRAKQKVLALQEAVKRAQAATREMEQRVQEVEGALPSLREKREDTEQVYIRVKEDTDQARREREKEIEADGRRIEGMKGELVNLGNKLERAYGKREKLEGTMPDLEEQLREIEKEIESVEADSVGYNSESWEGGGDDETGRQREIVTDTVPAPHHPIYLPVQRQHRQQIQHPPGTIGWPPPAPIQRPFHAGTSGPYQQSWPVRQSRAASHHTTLSSQQPHHRQLLTHSPTQSQMQNSHAHSTVSDSSSPPHSFAQTSTLSSRAPPFEPSRGFTHVFRTSMPESGSPLTLGQSPASLTTQQPAAPRLVAGNVAWANTVGSQGEASNNNQAAA